MSGLAVLPFGTADTCTACTHVHGQPTDWPICPQHGHWLRGGQLTEDGFLYTCPAKYPAPCTHTHTQQERATMTATNEAAASALAIRDGQDFWTPAQIAALTQFGVENASKGDLDVFLHRCQVTGLDPFTGQISMIKRGGRWTIQTGIDGYRVIAQRAAARDGTKLTYGETIWFDAAGGPHDIWLGDDPPAGAMVTIYKDGEPFTGKCRYKSFVQLKDGKPMAQWAVMPDHLLAKCAEAQAFRRAFPFDLQDITTADETAHLDSAAPSVVLTAHQIPEPQPPRRPQTPEARRSLMAGIRAQFDRIGLEDAEERKVYVAKLANKEPGDELADSDLRFVLDSLSYDPEKGEGCEDLAALIDLCAVEAS